MRIKLHHTHKQLISMLSMVMLKKWKSTVIIRNQKRWDTFRTMQFIMRTRHPQKRGLWIWWIMLWWKSSIRLNLPKKIKMFTIIVAWHESWCDTDNLKNDSLTFGINSSPFLAIGTAQSHVKESKENFPEASEAVENDMYVNDVLTGAENESNALLYKSH